MFNPLEEKSFPIEKTFMDWKMMYPKSYRLCETDPYTKARIILMNGTEFEATGFSRAFSRRCDNQDLKRELALMRRIEQQQQKRISCLRPKEETILETTLSYEQLAVDLTAELALMEENCNAKNALNFALLEDFDHLYRYSNLMDLEYGTDPKNYVGDYTEIMPARPTISEHRHPYDSILYPADVTDAPRQRLSLQTILNTRIIVAAEQQTMNFYMNVASLYNKSDLGRRLYQEIGMIEEEHVSQYESLTDPTLSNLEELFLHELTECYLYYSALETEKDPYIRRIWDECLIQEIAHLHKAKDLLEIYEKKDWQELVPSVTFSSPLILRPHIEYVRTIIATTAGNTERREDILSVKELPNRSSFYFYQGVVNNDIPYVASHAVIDARIRCKGMDYRYETSPNPVKVLSDRKIDNVTLGRIPGLTPSATSFCGTTESDCGCSVKGCDNSVRW